MNHCCERAPIAKPTWLVVVAAALDRSTVPESDSPLISKVQRGDQRETSTPQPALAKEDSNISLI